MKKAENNKKPLVVAVSGGFDPVHIGHVRMFNEAKKLGDKLVVILNNDNWLKNKKGEPFMPEAERKEILEALAAVDEVVLTSHPEIVTDTSVCAELEKIRPDIFANGGDRRNPDEIPSLESVVCNKHNIKMVFNIGHGGKVQSSSWLVNKQKNNKK
ncbi:MAG: adenylyltransferase/cytidyltransferase family protein [Patescibacteria group bacterium]